MVGFQSLETLDEVEAKIEQLSGYLNAGAIAAGFSRLQKLSAAQKVPPHHPQIVRIQEKLTAEAKLRLEQLAARHISAIFYACGKLGRMDAAL